jgi:hypothetical protein
VAATHSRVAGRGSAFQLTAGDRTFLYSAAGELSDADWTGLWHALDAVLARPD